MTPTEQDQFDANHLAITGTLAHHWTEQACKDWMASQTSLPWSFHIGCNTPEVFSMQLVRDEDGRPASFASVSLIKDQSAHHGYCAPSLSHLRMNHLETATREKRKALHGF